MRTSRRIAEDERLVARTRAVAPDGHDVLSALEPGGFAWWAGDRGFVANGVTALLAPSETQAFLSEVEVDDEVGADATGPIAVGALGFEPLPGPTVVVPRTVIGTSPDGTRWLTEIDGASGPAVRPRAVTSPPHSFDVKDGMSRADWSSAVRSVLCRIEAGELEKVVLARHVTITADEDFDVPLVVQRLRHTQNDCFVFACGDFVGASPELLVSRQGDVVRSLPMAGTAPVAKASSTRWLGSSAKNLEEHRLVVEALTARLSVFCESKPAVFGPEVRAFEDLAHLATRVEGALRPEAPGVAELALALHPTPAVAGTPTDTALAAIAELERGPRGRYAGPVGWTDARGDGEMAVALRCADLRESTAVLHAGAGIVAQSDPDEEWSETEAKFEPMLRVLTVR